jgi:hypothetical protein
MLIGSTEKAGRRGILLAVSLLFLFFVKSKACTSLAGDDSLKSKYDINDPRNPNCPCHKYQQLADNEYKQMQSNQINHFSYTPSLGTDRSKHQSRNQLFYKRKKKAELRIRYFLSSEKRKKWKRSFRTSDCFTWN